MKLETRLLNPPTTATQPWTAERRRRKIRLSATRRQVPSLTRSSFFIWNALAMLEKKICRIWFAYKLFALMSEWKLLRKEKLQILVHLHNCFTDSIRPGFETLIESMYKLGLRASVALRSISTCNLKFHHYQYVQVCILSMYYYAVKSLSFHLVFFRNASIMFHCRKLKSNSIEISPPQQ